MEGGWRTIPRKSYNADGRAASEASSATALTRYNLKQHTDNRQLTKHATIKAAGPCR